MCVLLFVSFGCCLFRVDFPYARLCLFSSLIDGLCCVVYCLCVCLCLCCLWFVFVFFTFVLCCLCLPLLCVLHVCWCVFVCF